ncbi:MAG TPA: hypothetical protein VN736_13255 [Candidatus Limnocylindrales bacterium]|nr:hypothetical protein [Candidatus Limnocylindrales bacterium]
MAICTTCSPKDLPNGSLGVAAVYEVNGREFVLFALAAAEGKP